MAVELHWFYDVWWVEVLYFKGTSCLGWDVVDLEFYVVAIVYDIIVY